MLRNVRLQKGEKIIINISAHRPYMVVCFVLGTLNRGGGTAGDPSLHPPQSCVFNAGRLFK